MRSRIKRSRVLPSSQAAPAMAERHATSEQDFEDFVRRSRNPSGSCVGASTCKCGAEKGQARWARYAQGSPKGTKCYECGSTSKWRLEKGYTNKGRVALETKKQRFAAAQEPQGRDGEHRARAAQ